MPRLHIGEANGFNTYSVNVHTPTPAGVNAAGVSWAEAIRNSGNNVSAMTVGNGPGQISNSENTQVLNGSVYEASFTWGNNPTWTDQQRTDDLNVRAAQAVEQKLAELQGRLMFFGMTVA